ncbi:MAG: fluoride efflux transporter FluC, partial [Planctomycetota bacterium]
ALFISGPFPWGTFVVNVTGCWAMGGLMYLFKDRGLLGPGHRLFLMVGLVGGYTTFSSFGYESDALMRQGHPAMETLYAVASAVFGLAAVWAGRISIQGLGRLVMTAGRVRRGGVPRRAASKVAAPLPLEEELPE